MNNEPLSKTIDGVMEPKWTAESCAKHLMDKYLRKDVRVKDIVYEMLLQAYNTGSVEATKKSYWRMKKMARELSADISRPVS